MIARQTLPILMYHSICEGAAPGFRQFVVSPKAFSAQMEYLSEYGYTALTVTQAVDALAGRGRLPDKPVVLTFDDGFADFYTTAFPIMRSCGFTSTLFVTTNTVGGTSRWLADIGEGDRAMLTWEQLAELQAAGIECAGHTLSHPQLDMLPADQVVREITQSKQLLEARLGAPVVTMAYPYGYYSAEVVELVRKAGYSSACAVRLEMSSTGDDIFTLGRLIVTPNTDIAAFAQLLTTDTPMLQKRLNDLKIPVWRFIRGVSRKRQSIAAVL